MVEGHAMARAACHHGVQGSTPDQSVWGLWWTKWHGDRISPVSVMPPTLYFFIHLFICHQCYIIFVVDSVCYLHAVHPVVCYIQ